MSLKYFVLYSSQATGKMPFGRGSRINTDRFPKREPKAQASRGVRGHAPPVNILDSYSVKSTFQGFRVIQTGYWSVPFTLSEALKLGKFFIH